MMSSVHELCQKAKDAASVLAQASAHQRSQVLYTLADLIEQNLFEIQQANALDMQGGRERGMKEALLDRLLLDEQRIANLSDALRVIARDKDPLGEVVAGRTLASGVELTQKRVPLGVVGIIFEARPNVTIDAFALCIRSGNACLLKGGSAADHSARALVDLCKQALMQENLPEDAVQYLSDDASYTKTLELLCARGLVDVVIPRGSKRLIDFCVEHAQVPTIETGTGNCHLYVHKNADIAKARAILLNGKCSRPGVCNALESLLLDASLCSEDKISLLQALLDEGVELRCDQATYNLIDEHELISLATAEDFETEFLDMVMSVREVADLDEALQHIAQTTTHHSEAIITESYEAADRFLNTVDAAAVYVNASTRFSDGSEFGLGAEIGISTQKLHARGPMGAAALTTTKYLLRGSGQIR